MLRNKFAASAAIMAAACSAAHAGALERSGQGITALFEEGRYAELSFASVSPDTSGAAVAALGGFASGDLTPSYLQFGAAYKADINNQWSYALIYDQPLGADVSYPLGTNYFAQGSQAEFTSHALTGVLRYKFNENFSVHGGLRLQSVSASAAIPFVSGYRVEGASDLGLGYLAGVAYERPDIALRVSLTYNSAITHKNDTVETSVALGGPNSSVTETEAPQSVNLEFQTGVAKDTLVFGGLRWADYSEFDISPANYQVLTGGASLLSYDDDIYSWSLGVARRINDNWAVSAALGYERANGGFVSNLGPTDGLRSLQLAAIYTKGNMRITTGLRYIKVGSAQTAIPGNAPASNFEDNTAVALGVRVGFNF